MRRLVAAVFALLGPACELHAAQLDFSQPAKVLFSQVPGPTPGKPMSIGSYAMGCMSGAVPLPVTGPHWQVMRLSRNRNWGHPALLSFIERLSAKAPHAGWPGILVGDMGQSRGGPMLSGHASHEIGLDVDIWFTPMPQLLLTLQERETMAPLNLVADRDHLNLQTWTPNAGYMVKAAAQDPQVERIFVNATIKRELCATAGNDRAWLGKVRPWYGHDDHFHIRLACQPGSPLCKKQAPVPPGDGCDASLNYWFTDEPYRKATPPPPDQPPREVMMSDLPPACRDVLTQGR